MTAKWAKGTGGPSGDETQNLITHPLTSEGADASEDGAMPEVHGDGSTTGSLRAAGGGSSRDYVAALGVRRLSPVECERLQGMPDNHTLISDGKVQSDSARYRQIGNSVAVPCIAQITKRIADYDERDGGSDG